jgi:hypothetical protein
MAPNRWELVAHLGGAPGASARGTYPSHPSDAFDDPAAEGDAKTSGGRGESAKSTQEARVDRRVYVEAMHLHPVVLHLHFTPTGTLLRASAHQVLVCL